MRDELFYLRYSKEFFRHFGTSLHLELILIILESIKEKDEKEEKIKREESKSEETKFYEVPPNGYKTLPLTEVIPANVNYVIPQENKEEKMLTETIILPKIVRFVEERKGEQQKIGENKSKDEISSLDEYELKLRRRSKEALELVNKICGLQAQETEKVHIFFGF